MSPAPHVLLLDGWQHRRAPLHWQGWLAERLAERGWSVDYLTLPDPEHPRYADWSATVRGALAARPAGGTVVVAHGLSVLLWLRMCADPALGPVVVSRALLVAPPAPGAHGGDVSEYRPDAATSAGLSRRHASAPLLVSADDDPYLPGGAAGLAAATGLSWVRLAEGAHLNASSGFGPWPEALEWCLSGVWPAAPSAPNPQERTVHDTPPSPAVPSAALERRLAEVYEPAGHRLGILSAGVDAAAVAAVDRVIARRGLEPGRRHARVQPRPGESAVRAEDLADFVRRYGHEYQAAVLAPGVSASDATGALALALREERVAALEPAP